MDFYLPIKPSPLYVRKYYVIFLSFFQFSLFLIYHSK